MANRWGKSGKSDRFYFRELQNHCEQCLQLWNLKTLAPWKKSYDKPRQHFKTQRHYFANKGPYTQFSRSVVSNSFWPHGLQHARNPCPSPTPRACSNSCPLSQWCHPANSSCHLQHHRSKPSILLHSAFFMVQLSHSYMTTGKTIALTRWTFVSKVMSLLFNMLSRLVMAFLPRNKHLLTSWLQSSPAMIWEPKKIVCHYFVSPSICH